MKYKKQMVLFLSLIVGMLLLAGCGVSENLKSTDSKSTTYTGTLSIGDIMYDDYYSYYFDGFLQDSVVLNVGDVKSVYIPFETTDWITLPYTSVKIKIKSIDKAKGTIDIELHEKNEDK